MKSCAYAEWDVGLAAEKARAAFTYVARMLPEDAPPCTLEALGAADRAVLEAEEAHDWARYLEALRELCRVSRREATRTKLGAA